MHRLLLFVALLGCRAQQDEPVEACLLAKIQARIADNLRRLPNYTCAERVARSARTGSAHRWKVIDNVHLEVALVDGNELYGWPGAHRISESKLSSLVGGTIGNGDFALVARGIFESHATSFIFRGSSTVEEQQAIRYDYRVPLEASSYHLKSAGSEAVVPYHGSFWVDPDTLDLLRLELVADQIPDHLGLAASTKVLQYQRVKIGASEFVLPSAATLHMIDFSGRENRNHSRFEDCRQYTGQSALSFVDFDQQPALAPLPSFREVDLPSDFEADLTLLAPLDFSTSAVGDPIEVRLARALKAGREVLVPRGAILTARIVELHLAGSIYHLGLAFESLQFQNSRANLSARRNRISLPLKFASAAHRASGGLAIESEHLHLPRGFTFCLHSKLIESQQ